MWLFCRRSLTLRPEVHPEISARCRRRNRGISLCVCMQRNGLTLCSQIYPEIEITAVTENQ